MAVRRRKQQGPRYVEMGVFAVLTLVIAVTTFYFLTNFGRGGYRIGVHFIRAFGAAQGSQVFFSGVVIGSVDEVRVLPDNTVDLILAISKDTNIPKNSKFLIRPSFAGSPTLVIDPPKPELRISELPTPLPTDLILERRILPVEQQPVGSGPPGFEELLAEGIGLQKKSVHILNMMASTKGRVFGSLQASRANALALETQMHAIPTTLLADLRPKLNQLQANLADAKHAMKLHDHRQLAAVASSLKNSAAALNTTAAGFHATTSSPQVRANMQASQQQIGVAMANMRQLQTQFSGLTGDSQTRLQLADAAAQLQAALQRIGSLLHPGVQGSPAPQK